ncbi:MAG: hypothetical protein Fur0032_01870 [Terrimicrobiaceae bacterium]
MIKIINFLRWKLGLTSEAASQRALAAIPLSASDLAIDCGANVGAMTAILARSGATVHAFEPNPHAFEVLSNRFKGQPNVICHQAAIADQSGRVSLYLHENSATDEVYWSNGSSLIQEKGNVSKDRSVEVEAVDLADFITGLGTRVRILKMDIEGAEFAVLERLMATQTLDLCDHVFVETHDDKIPALRDIGIRVRSALRSYGARHVNLDWV